MKDRIEELNIDTFIYKYNVRKLCFCINGLSK